jgi:outer membrane receptor protein involved in Fe transport
MHLSNRSNFQFNKISLCLLSALGALTFSTEAADQNLSKLSDPSIKVNVDNKIQPTLNDTNSKEESEEDIEVIHVIGSMIQGATINGALPVSIIGGKDIDAIGATSGSELFASIPSNGTVSFNGNDVGGVYSARGDVSSINLRSIGTGNTLALLNGRRLVQHPGSQTENSVPVTTVNLNSIPVKGISAVEVLHDGAAAIYGSDAVAGVVNSEMIKDFTGYRFDLQYGQAENNDRDKLNLNTLAGWDLNDGMTNISASLNYYHSAEVMASEVSPSSNSDLRSHLLGTDFEGDTNFRNNSAVTPFGRFDAEQSVDGLTSSAGRFHIENVDDSDSDQQCVLENGFCIDSGSITRDTQAFNTNGSRTLLPETERLNTFIFLNHELNSGTQLYSELGYYFAESNSQRAPTATLTSAPVTIASTGYWNPLGSGPNQLTGYDIPAEGINVEVDAYRLVDGGVRQIEVKNTSYRLLGGARGNIGNWGWDSAALYSAAKTVDKTANRTSLSLFQDSINQQDSSAFNPFCVATCNSQETIDSFLIDISRTGETELALVDFKVSNNDFFSLPAGKLGIALGTELRYESFENIYDDRLNGTITYQDSVTGIVYPSDVMGSSGQPNADGSRNILSAFIEISGPLISPEMNIPLVSKLDFQLAGRYEDYNDVGGVFKPKAVLSWHLFDDLQIRGSYSEGFKAPNLEQLHTASTSRVNSATDNYRCQAQINKGEIDRLSQCSAGDSVSNIRLGNTDLKPEDDYTYGLGLVYSPSFVDNLTFNVDYWRIEQENLVGIRSTQTIADLDYFARLNGSSNNNVIRSEPTADDIAFFDGSGLTAVGDMVEVIGLFENLDSRVTEGLDFSIYYKIDNTSLGDFNFKLNAAKLLKAFQTVDEEGSQLESLGLALEDVGDLIQKDGRPEWQASGTLSWNYNNWGAGLYGKYVGEFFDTSAVQNDTGEFWQVKSWSTFSLYGQYSSDSGALEGSRIRVGLRNMFDKKPPLADERFGYNASLHNVEGRYLYVNFSMDFE